MHIRYFADTTDGPHGLIALAYVRSMLRIAPVRLITYAGELYGGWQAFYALLTTPMIGKCVNAVCIDPSRWIFSLKVPAPKANAPTQGGEIEIIQDERELYTDGMRNVLFAPCLPRSRAELGTALRYEALVVPAVEDLEKWRELGGVPRLVATPVTDHQAVRDAINP